MGVKDSSLCVFHNLPRVISFNTRKFLTRNPWIFVIPLTFSLDYSHIVCSLFVLFHSNRFGQVAGLVHI